MTRLATALAAAVLLAAGNCHLALGRAADHLDYRRMVSA